MCMKKQKACDLNVKVIYDLDKVIYDLDIKVEYYIVNIQIFRLGGIRSHIIENTSVTSTLTLSPGP